MMERIKATEMIARISKARKKDRVTTETFHEETLSVDPVLCDPSFVHVSVSMGRTISLGNFEFARVSVHLSARVAPECRDAAFSEIAEFVRIVVKNEASCIQQDEDEESPVEEMSDFAFEQLKRAREIEIGLEYGITMSLARFDNQRIDITTSARVDNAEEIFEKLKCLQQWLSKRMDKEKQQSFEEYRSGSGVKL